MEVKAMSSFEFFARMRAGEAIEEHTGGMQRQLDAELEKSLKKADRKTLLMLQKKMQPTVFQRGSPSVGAERGPARPGAKEPFDASNVSDEDLRTIIQKSTIWTVPVKAPPREVES